MAGFILKVSTAELKQKSNEITGQINKIESCWKQIDEIISKSKSYWVGEASDDHQKYRKEVSEDARKVIKRLREHPEDLLKMAGVYEEAEQKAVALAQALPDDVII